MKRWCANQESWRSFGVGLRVCIALKIPKCAMRRLIWGRIVHIYESISPTGTGKGILPTLVTTCGLKHNANAAMITNVVTLDDLFRC